MKITSSMIRGFIEASRCWDIKSKKIISRIKFFDDVDNEEIVLIKKSNISIEATKWENKYINKVNEFYDVNIVVKGKCSTENIV